MLASFVAWTLLSDARLARSSAGIALLPVPCNIGASNNVNCYTTYDDAIAAVMLTCDSNADEREPSRPTSTMTITVGPVATAEASTVAQQRLFTSSRPTGTGGDQNATIHQHLVEQNIKVLSPGQSTDFDYQRLLARLYSGYLEEIPAQRELKGEEVVSQLQQLLKAFVQLRNVM